MMRARLLQLPVIPIGILLVFYEFGAASAASEAIHLDTPTAPQAEVAPEEDGTVRSPVGEKIGAPANSSEGTPLLGAPPGGKGIDSQLKSPGIGAQDASKQAAPGANIPADVKPSKAPSANNPPAAIKPPAAQKMPPNKSPSILQMLEGHERELWIGVSIAAVFFFIGWISGGNYYVRRERRRRTKLSF